jgi:hypothetical protein
LRKKEKLWQMLLFSRIVIKALQNRVVIFTKIYNGTYNN